MLSLTEKINLIVWFIKHVRVNGTPHCNRGTLARSPTISCHQIVNVPPLTLHLTGCWFNCCPLPPLWAFGLWGFFELRRVTLLFHLCLQSPSLAGSNGLGCANFKTVDKHILWTETVFLKKSPANHSQAFSTPKNLFLLLLWNYWSYKMLTFYTVLNDT